MNVRTKNAGSSGGSLKELIGSYYESMVYRYFVDSIADL